MNRRTFIGGSDIAGVMGLSRWQTPLQVWAEKVGKLDPPEDNEYMEMGRELEETVARMFTKRTGKKVRRTPKSYVHPDYDYMSCQVDRLVEGTDELLECKTTSAYKEEEWQEDEIPMEYILQVMWQLGITGRKLGHIAVIIGGNKFVYKEIPFDKELWEDMVSKAKTFWGLVKRNQEPFALGDDSGFLGDLHPADSGVIKDAPDKEELIVIRGSLKAIMKSTEIQIAEVEAKLKQAIGDDLGILTAKYKVTWKPQDRTSVDTQRLKDDGLYDKYAKKSSHRVMRVSEVKEKA